MGIVGHAVWVGGCVEGWLVVMGGVCGGGGAVEFRVCVPWGHVCGGCGEGARGCVRAFSCSPHLSLPTNMFLSVR